jgi:hypothetical protein
MAEPTACYSLTSLSLLVSITLDGQLDEDAGNGERGNRCTGLEDWFSGVGVGGRIGRETWTRRNSGEGGEEHIDEIESINWDSLRDRAERGCSLASFKRWARRSSENGCVGWMSGLDRSRHLGRLRRDGKIEYDADPTFLHDTGYSHAPRSENGGEGSLELDLAGALSSLLFGRRHLVHALCESSRLLVLPSQPPRPVEAFFY